MATIGWIDFSTNDRNRVGSVLDMLTPEGMVDELGMGTIRDALANELFPGISTIQTRAKYFFIIPYILLDYQKNKSKGISPTKYLEDQENETMWTLAEKYEHKEGGGVIGISKKREEKIARRPSAIYWNGIYTYRFIHTNGLSLESFLKQSVSPTMDSLLSSVQQGDDSTGDDADTEHENMFQIKVPTKLDWAENRTLDLTQDEAEFFRDRITSIAKDKLIAELLQHDELWKLFINTDSFMQFAKAAMSLPISDKLKAILILAHDFSELMYGAHLAYNCLLQRKVDSEHYDDEFLKWSNGIQENMLDYANFNPDLIFSYANTTRQSTVQFVNKWWSQTQSNFQDIAQRDALIAQQEAIVKGGKARLHYNKTDDVKKGQWIGLNYLKYRFTQARIILTDIKTGITT